MGLIQSTESLSGQNGTKLKSPWGRNFASNLHQETWVWSLGWEDRLEEDMVTHSSILAWRSHGQRSLEGYSPWVTKSWSRLELLSTHTHTPPQKAHTSQKAHTHNHKRPCLPCLYNTDHDLPTTTCNSTKTHPGVYWSLSLLQLPRSVFEYYCTSLIRFWE